MKYCKLQYRKGCFRDTDKSECEIGSFVGWENNEYANKNRIIRGGIKPSKYNCFSATFTLKNNLNNDNRLKIIINLSKFILIIIALILQFFVSSLLH